MILHMNFEVTVILHKLIKRQFKYLKWIVPIIILMKLLDFDESIFPK